MIWSEGTCACDPVHAPLYGWYLRLNWRRYAYHAALVALSKGQQYATAMDVFVEMKQDGVPPDTACYRCEYSHRMHA
jgi:pentatricopeptide repeat protein